MKEKYYRIMFLVAGIWAIAVSFPYVFIYEKAFPMAGMKVPGDPVWFVFSSLCVTVFGIGYIIVSRDIAKNRGIVVMGVIGKIMVFCVFLFYTLKGSLSPLFMVNAATDLAFAALFLEFLIYTRNGN